VSRPLGISVSGNAEGKLGVNRGVEEGLLAFGRGIPRDAILPLAPSTVLAARAKGSIGHSFENYSLDFCSDWVCNRMA
jgi:hypothetical protein